MFFTLASQLINSNNFIYTFLAGAIIYILLHYYIHTCLLDGITGAYDILYHFEKYFYYMFVADLLISYALVRYVYTYKSNDEELPKRMTDEEREARRKKLMEKFNSTTRAQQRKQGEPQSKQDKIQSKQGEPQSKQGETQSNTNKTNKGKTQTKQKQPKVEEEQSKQDTPQSKKSEVDKSETDSKNSRTTPKVINTRKNVVCEDDKCVIADDDGEYEYSYEEYEEYEDVNDNNNVNNDNNNTNPTNTNNVQPVQSKVEQVPNEEEKDELSINPNDVHNHPLMTMDIADTEIPVFNQ